MVDLITEHIATWTAAEIPQTNGGRGRGRGSNGQSPHGIKKLRELILELAVRGKLVPQDPNDDPASTLLEKIAKEKAKLIKEGKIKKQKPLSEITEDEKPFKLPQSWEWTRLEEIGHDWGQKTPESEFTYIDVSSIDNNVGYVKDPKVLGASEAPSRARKIVKVGTVIYSTVRPYLKNICVIDQEYSPEPIASTAFAILHPLQQMPGRYIFSFLRSPVFVRYVESVQTGIAYPAINDRQFWGGLIPLPPLAEQHRIVAKVDELMALCDKLEQQQSNSNETHQTLVETLLATLTTVADPADFAQGWQRIEVHFDTLFTTEESIDQLKQTILQLAVMGKLVPQDPNDEPASVLLEKIAKEKTRLIKEGKIKKQKPLPEISEDEKPFGLPKEWEWARLGIISAKITDGDHKTPPRIPEGYRLLSAKNVRDGYLDFENCDLISEEHYLKSRERCLPQTGDLLIVSVGGTIGRTSLVPEDSDFSLVRSVALIKPLLFNSYYLKHAMDSELLQASIHGRKRGGAQPCLYLSEISEFMFSLPPLTEQYRIVAKVDELLALCGTLKERLHDAQITQVQLADAIVEQAVA